MIGEKTTLAISVASVIELKQNQCFFIEVISVIVTRSVHQIAVSKNGKIK